jgi:hypothetical protein
MRAILRYPAPLELRSALVWEARTESAPPYPWRVLIATSSRAEGEGTRFFWVDPLPGGVLKDFPPLALPAALSGLRLTHPADPMRHTAAPSGPRERLTGHRSLRRPIQYSRLLKSYTLPNEVSAGVFF